MPPATVLSVENLSKRYLIGHQRNYETDLRDAIPRAFRHFTRTASDLVHGRQIISGEVEEFWALKDISFELKRGDVLGVIGRNGAGKSTLLKILSRITEPTRGRIVMRGRVASLLEVGTGFHTELSGRENIFLNGAILGMKRADIQKKFDEIVAYSGIEKFLDTPVKRYSSGMYMRLAFAVAAHLDPDILIIDEVLAVGDAEFQKKCLATIRSASRNEGRTVIFVSHHMSAISQLCSMAIRLSDGMVASRGDCKGVIKDHLSTAETATQLTFRARADKPSITRLSLNMEALTEGHLRFELDYESPFSFIPLAGIVISSSDGIPVFGSNCRMHNDGYVAVSQSVGTVKMHADSLPLASGTYVLSVWLGDWHTNYHEKLDVIQFEFHSKSPQEDRPSSSVIGCLEWPAKWSNNERTT